MRQKYTVTSYFASTFITPMKSFPCLLLIASVLSCNTSEIGSSRAGQSSNSRTASSQNSGLFNADILAAKFKSAPYNFYFTELEEVNDYYWRQRGYASKDAISSSSSEPMIEIQRKPNSDSATRIYYRLRHLTSLKMTEKDVAQMLDFIAEFDDEASKVYARNFKSVFHYSPDGRDSNHYYNIAKGVSSGIDHNLDLVHQDKGTPDDAFFEATAAPLK